MGLDTNIYNQIRKRDEQGLSLLYENYSDSLYGIAYRVIGSHAFAEDALQKSFLKIWNHIDQYDASKATLFTWMAQIVRNSAIDIKRLKSFQNEKASESFDTHVHHIGSMETDTDAMDVKKIIDGLDDKYAFVIEHLYLKGYSQSELSKEFDIPLGTIKSRVKKGIDILRTNLDNEKKLFLGFFSIILLIILLLLCQ